MAKWDLSKLPEGRKPLPDEWFAERAQMQERINGLEAKLAKAIGDLGRLSRAEVFGDGGAWGMRLSEDALGREILARMKFARTTLAELKGEK